MCLYEYNHVIEKYSIKNDQVSAPCLEVPRAEECGVFNIRPSSQNLQHPYLMRVKNQHCALGYINLFVDMRLLHVSATVCHLQGASLSLRVT
jgi:hypothetical protein